MVGCALRCALCAERKSYLDENHGGNLLGREGLLLAEVVDLDAGVTAVIDDLEGPRLDVLLDGRVIEAATDQTPEKIRSETEEFQDIGSSSGEKTHLASKTVFRGFMAALFFAASPIRRSFSVKETKEGVVKEPCSLAMISTLVPS